MVSEISAKQKSKFPKLSSTWSAFFLAIPVSSIKLFRGRRRSGRDRT